MKQRHEWSSLIHRREGKSMKYVRRWQMRIGPRGSALLAVAWIYAWMAFGLWYGAMRTPPAAALWMVDKWWAVLWAAAAILCVVTALARKDDLGFIGAGALSLAWSVGHYFSYFESGALRGGVAGSIWLGLVILLVVVGWRRG